MKIIGHRGSSYEAPENTLGSFQLAWQEEADGIEFDVHLSRDGRVVVIHDDNTRRTAGLNAPVVAQTVAELQRLDAGSWKNGRWRGETIPELSRVLEDAPRGKLLFIEIKCGAEIIAPLKAVIASAGRPIDEVLFVGFSLPAMREVKKAFPQHRVILNVETSRDAEGRWVPPWHSILESVKSAGLDGAGPGFRGGVEPELLNALQRHRLRSFIWTVDDPVAAKQFRSRGVDYLVTNRPGWIRKQSG